MDKNTVKLITDIIIKTLSKFNVTDRKEILFINKCDKYSESREHSAPVILITIKGIIINKYDELKTTWTGTRDNYELYVPRIKSLISIDNADDAVLIIDRKDGAAVIRCTNLCDEVKIKKSELINSISDFLTHNQVISDPTNSVDKELFNITMIDELWK